MQISLRQHLRRVGRKERVFPFDQGHLRHVWNSKLRQLGLPPFPLHTLRHSKPSEEVLLRTRSVEDVRRRGRWNQLKSVQRYSKPHVLTAVMAEIPPALQAKAAVALQEFHAALLQEIQKQAAHPEAAASPWIRALMVGLRGARRPGSPHSRGAHSDGDGASPRRQAP